MGICVCEKSTDGVGTRWRDTDVEGNSRFLYLPLPPTSPLKSLRAPILAGSCHYVSEKAKLSPCLAAVETPIHQLISAVWANCIQMVWQDKRHSHKLARQRRKMNVVHLTQ